MVNALDLEALGEWATELSSDPEQALIEALGRELEYRATVTLTGPTSSVSTKVPDWLLTMLQLVCERKSLPWRTQPQLLRDALYYFVKTIQHQELTNDPKWRRAMVRANVADWLTEAKDKEETLKLAGGHLRELLTTYVRMGDIQKAADSLVAFWDQAGQLPEDERQGYELLFSEVPVVRYVAGVCEGRLPEGLIPSEEDMARIAVEDFQIDVEERVPVGEKRVRSPEEIRKRHAEYMKKYRAGEVGHG